MITLKISLCLLFLVAQVNSILEQFHCSVSFKVVPYSSLSPHHFGLGEKMVVLVTLGL